MKTEAGKSKNKTLRAAAAVVLLIVIAIYSVVIYHYEYSVYFKQDATSIAGYYKGVCNNLAEKTNFYSAIAHISESRQEIREKTGLEALQDAEEAVSADFDYVITKAVSYVIWDNTTGQVLDTNREQLPEWLQTRDAAAAGMEATMEIDGIAVGNFALDGNVCLVAFGSQGDGNADVSLCVFTEDWQARRYALFGTLTAAVLAVMLAGGCLLLLSRLRNKYYSEAYVQKKLPFLRPQNYYQRIKETIAVITVTFLFTSLLLFSVQSMLIVNHSVAKANQGLIQLEENRNQNQEVLYAAAVRACEDCANDIAMAIQSSEPEKLDDWLKEMVDATGVDEITLYDKNGIISDSSTPYRGYSLSTDETTSEYKLWQILCGGVNELAYYSEAEDRSYIAVRRMDEVGILRLVASGDLLRSLSEKVGFADLLKTQNGLDAYTLYFKRDAADELQLIKGGSDNEKILTNTLPTPAKGETTIGMRDIDGESCLYIAAGGEDQVTVFAYPLTDSLKNLALYLVLTAAVYFVIAAVLSLTFAKTVSFNEVNGNHDPAPYHNFCAERKKTLRLILSVLAVCGFIAVLRGVSVLGETDAHSFFECWEKGLNLMAVYRILLSGTVLLGIYSIIDTLNTMLCKLLHSKGTTISTLISQIIKLGGFVVYLVLSMAQLGVDAVAILSSLGLAGLALSIGSKDTISDMVAGLFIAFEGQLQLGDFVETNGFSGEIVSLGIRTTTLRSGYKEMVLNNTDVKKVINSSRGTGSISFSVTFPFDTDLDALKELLAASAERFQKACNGGLVGPLVFSGVNGFASYGVECLFIGSVSSSRLVSKCSMACRTELLKLLKENGLFPIGMNGAKKS